MIGAIESNTTIVVSLMATIGVLAGGFALLGKVALKIFLGPNLDGKQGAWATLTDAVEGLGGRLEQIESKSDQILDILDVERKRASGG